MKLLCMLLFFPLVALSQVTFKGKVVDKNTKRPIAYAGIYVLRLLYPTEGIVRLILTTIETFVLLGLLGYYFLISKDLKVRAIKKIKHILGIKYTEITP